jgi:hypothetical protein
MAGFNGGKIVARSTPGGGIGQFTGAKSRQGKGSTRVARKLPPKTCLNNTGLAARFHQMVLTGNDRCPRGTRH